MSRKKENACGKPRVAPEASGALPAANGLGFEKYELKKIKLKCNVPYFVPSRCWFWRLLMPGAAAEVVEEEGAVLGLPAGE